MTMTVFPEIGNVLKPLANTGGIEISYAARINAIQHAICAAFGVEFCDLISKRRLIHFSRPRQAGYLLARNLTSASLPTIAKHFARNDHTTVMWGIVRAEELLHSDYDFATRYAHAEAMIKGAA